MDFKEILKTKKAIFVELDDVLFPEKDYDLQVFYLFAQFVELTEQISAKPIIEFLQQQYELCGGEDVFDKLIQKFDFLAKYQVHFNRLFKTARLPLKLFMYQNMLSFLTLAVDNKAQVFLVTEGDPQIQLNKIKQLDWGGLGENVRLFFADELGQSELEVVAELMIKNDLSEQDILFLCKNKIVNQQSNLLNLPYILATDINN